MLGYRHIAVRSLHWTHTMSHDGAQKLEDASSVAATWAAQESTSSLKVRVLSEESWFAQVCLDCDCSPCLDYDCSP